MRHSHPGSFREQASFLRRQFLQDGDLPFTDVLTEDVIAQALAAVGGWLDRIFSPLVTLWVFLGQVLSADHSCRAAVARLIAHRVARGQKPCSPRTGAYCQARKRLPEAFFSEAALRTGRALDAGADEGWLWKGRRVYVYDGSSVTMPDTPANQAAYPQPVAQKPGLGFPLARIAAVFSLACGAVVGLGICRYAGKGQSDLGMLRTLLDLFRPRRRRAGRPADVRVDRDGHAQAARGRLRVPVHLAPEGRLPPRQAPGRGRPRRRVAQAAEAPVDRPRGVRRAARVPDRPRVPRPGGASRASGRGSWSSPRRCWTPSEFTTGRPRPAVPGAVERGTRPEVAQADAADGRAAVQDAGAGPEGAVGPRPGVQPDPHGHGPGGDPARRRAAVDQLQGGGPDAGGVPAGDRPAGRARRRRSAGTSTSSCWTRSPATGSAIDPTGTSRGGGSGGPSRTTAS